VNANKKLILVFIKKLRVVHLNILNSQVKRTQLSPFMKIKKLFLLLLVSIFSMGYVLAQGGPPSPPDGGGGPGTGTDVPIPIDEQLCVGIILAILLGVYFIYSKRTSTQK
jgi:hypothetical protein